MADPFFDELSSVWEEEGLFARDLEGQLVRVVAATAADYDKDVTLTIDGEEVTVKKAVPLTDSQGDIVNDAEGRTIPRKTTIYDAATLLYNHASGGTSGLPHPIPTLCHREHMQPVGVCRVCSVEVARKDRDGNIVPGRKLLPACHHPVDSSMIIHTIDSPDAEARKRVRRAIRVLTELLAADHLGRVESGHGNELDDLRRRIEANPSRFTSRFTSRGEAPRPIDDSSELMLVDRNACILCERCMRSCGDIKDNHVIARAGKGYEARIAFDLDEAMGYSTCVSCGECMVSCPTNALTFRKPVESEWRTALLAQEGYSAVTADELKEHPLFRDISYRFLQWNLGAVVRRRVKAGDVLCKQGDHGATAFVLNDGEFGFWVRPPRPEAPPEQGFLSRWFSKNGPPPASGSDLPGGEPDGRLTPKDLILGEMTCMNNQRRSATVRALSDGDVFVIRRNVLYVLQRNKYARAKLDAVYRERALENHLREVPFLRVLSDEERVACRDFLSGRVELVTVDPKQIIFAQGEPADAFYMIRYGHVKVTQSYRGEERVLNYLRPNTSFGEIGLLSRRHLGIDVEEERWSRRTATCSALDNVELVRIRAKDFREMMDRFPVLKDAYLERARDSLGRDKGIVPAGNERLRSFLDQGTFNAQKLLVIDLEACTRCDECTRACADTHGGTTRLVRDGLRFDKFLVASACRSCTDPYCLVGCPVDAIHRKGGLEIVIEDHCIGCGQCATNCPYGNINMHGIDVPGAARAGERAALVVQQKATTCDLCRHIVKDTNQEVSCVYSCPHDAAFRMSGAELWEKTQASTESAPVARRKLPEPRAANGRAEAV